MKHFFHQTFLFWVITKFLMALAGLGSIFSLVTLETGILSFESMANSVIVFYGLLLGYSAYADIRSVKPNPGIRTVTGTISVLISMAIMVLIVMHVPKNPMIALLLSFWVLLLGIYEWMQVERLS